MSDIIYEKLEKGDTVIFARVLPKNGYYELLDLHIVSINENYCTGTDIKTKQTFLFDKKYAERVLFINRKEASDYLNMQKYENRNVKVAKE